MLIQTFIPGKGFITFVNEYKQSMPDDMSGFSNRKKLEEGDYYYSPEGYLVFTEQYHLRRGHCCKNGCKHCPYGFDSKTRRKKS